MVGRVPTSIRITRSQKLIFPRISPIGFEILTRIFRPLAPFYFDYRVNTVVEYFTIWRSLCFLEKGEPSMKFGIRKAAGQHDRRKIIISQWTHRHSILHRSLQSSANWFFLWLQTDSNFFQPDSIQLHSKDLLVAFVQKFRGTSNEVDNRKSSSAVKGLIATGETQFSRNPETPWTSALLFPSSCLVFVQSSFHKF